MFWEREQADGDKPFLRLKERGTDPMPYEALVGKPSSGTLVEWLFKGSDAAAVTPEGTGAPMLHTGGFHEGCEGYTSCEGPRG